MELKEFQKQFIEDIFGIEEWNQSNISMWILELAEKVFYYDYRKIENT